MDQSQNMQQTLETQQPPANGRTQTPNLSRQRIIQSAITLLDAEGLAGLSMRRLADHLDAGAMSLYWYFSTKDELLRATTDAVLGEIVLDDLPEEWEASVRALASDLRAAIHRHPWLRQTLSSAPAAGPHGVAVIETILLTLAQSGLSGRELDIGVTTLLGYIQGFTVGEHLWTDAFRDATSGTMTLPPEIVDAHPQFAAFVNDASMADPDLRFVSGINLILAGIAAEADA